MTSLVPGDMGCPNKMNVVVFEVSRNVNTSDTKRILVAFTSYLEP